jgi:hypothetical protein
MKFFFKGQFIIKTSKFQTMSIDIELKSGAVITDEKLISTLEQIIKYLKEGNTYTEEDKELLFYRIEEYVTGERKEWDPELVKYMFTGWFIHKHCAPLGGFSKNTEIIFAEKKH